MNLKTFIETIKKLFQEQEYIQAYQLVNSQEANEILEASKNDLKQLEDVVKSATEQIEETENDISYFVEASGAIGELMEAINDARTKMKKG